MASNVTSGGVLVVDFGAQYAQLIARRVREANVYSELVPYSITSAEVLAKSPSAIILSGGPSSVYADNAPTFDSSILTLGIPVFGICYGFQAMAQGLGGVVSQTGKIRIRSNRSHCCDNLKSFLVSAARTKSVDVTWRCRHSGTAGFSVTASTSDTQIAAFENETGLLAGVQFHPEVLHSEHGQAILKNWLINIAKCPATWTTSNIAATEIEKARQAIGTKRVICGLSGGVDSAVAAAIIQKAVGDQLTCVFVDHGLLRSGESEQVQRDFVASTGVQLVVVNAVDQFWQL
jgi:GMP synthase (glutamine-hydrolysing)